VESRWAIAGVAEKNRHREPHSRRDAVRWVALNIVGTEEGDPDFVSDGEKRARPSLPEYAVAGPVLQWLPLVTRHAALRRDTDRGIDGVPGGSRLVTFRFRVPVGGKNVTAASKLVCPRLALG
jgi:hypothetical protein